MSVRFGSLYKSHDCAGNPLPADQIVPAFPAQSVQVAFRNTGSGWEQSSGGNWSGVSDTARSSSLSQQQQVRSAGEARVNSYRSSGAASGGQPRRWATEGLLTQPVPVQSWQL